jgi:hypothetical protein
MLIRLKQFLTDSQMFFLAIIIAFIIGIVIPPLVSKNVQRETNSTNTTD